MKETAVVKGTVIPIAVLKDARRCQTSSVSYVLIGKVFGDLEGRFADGQLIHTSRVVAELSPRVFQTMDAVYRVEWEHQRDHGDETDYPATRIDEGMGAPE